MAKYTKAQLYSKFTTGFSDPTALAQAMADYFANIRSTALQASAYIMDATDQNPNPTGAVYLQNLSVTNPVIVVRADELRQAFTTLEASDNGSSDTLAVTDVYGVSHVISAEKVTDQIGAINDTNWLTWKAYDSLAKFGASSEAVTEFNSAVGLLAGEASFELRETATQITSLMQSSNLREAVDSVSSFIGMKQLIENPEAALGLTPDIASFTGINPTACWFTGFMDVVIKTGEVALDYYLTAALFTMKAVVSIIGIVGEWIGKAVKSVENYFATTFINPQDVSYEGNIPKYFKIPSKTYVAIDRSWTNYKPTQNARAAFGSLLATELVNGDQFDYYFSDGNVVSHTFAKADPDDSNYINLFEEMFVKPMNVQAFFQTCLNMGFITNQDGGEYVYPVSSTGRTSIGFNEDWTIGQVVELFQTLSNGDFSLSTSSGKPGENPIMIGIAGSMILSQGNTYARNKVTQFLISPDFDGYDWTTQYDDTTKFADLNLSYDPLVGIKNLCTFWHHVQESWYAESTPEWYPKFYAYGRLFDSRIFSYMNINDGSSLVYPVNNQLLIATLSCFDADTSYLTPSEFGTLPVNLESIMSPTEYRSVCAYRTPEKLINHTHDGFVPRYPVWDPDLAEKYASKNATWIDYSLRELDENEPSGGTLYSTSLGLSSLALLSASKLEFIQSSPASGTYVAYTRGQPNCLELNIEVKSDQENAKGVRNFLIGAVTAVAAVVAAVLLVKVFVGLKAVMMAASATSSALTRQYGDALLAGDTATATSLAKQIRKINRKQRWLSTIAGTISSAPKQATQVFSSNDLNQTLADIESIKKLVAG